MKDIAVKLALSFLLFVAAEGRAQSEGRGAKELFYDPVSGAVESSSPVRPADSERRSRPSSPADVARRLDSSSRRPLESRRRPGEGEPSAPLGLSYWIELVEQPGSLGIQVVDTRVFRSGERIRLHFMSNADGHIALIQLGSSGTGDLLFPNPAHGLSDTELIAGQERILPSENAWFRFDDQPGTERLIVVFAREREELERFPLTPSMDRDATASLVQTASAVRGSKDLLMETESQSAAEVGTYGVSPSGRPIILEISLQHR